ncbi:MAG: MBL fold metallo-hydrolase [Gammaproteobacteria bacterium]|nr:MBL fold metallo-hydrolase [Gammaproteobacteria bacterium]
MKFNDRRTILKAGLQGLTGLVTVPVLGGLAGCSGEQDAQEQAATQIVAAPTRLPTQALSENVTLINAAPGNVLALSSKDGHMLVDSGSAALAQSVQLTLGESRVHTLFNTHYHPDQAGGNALFGEAGAAIHSHEITREWLSADYYIPSQERWVSAPPEVARPTHTFREKGEMTAGAETIEYGYLLEAHTHGDAYVFLRDSNILAVGDVASPLKDPELDWYAGGWLGGRVNAMDDILELANADTLIVPAYGEVMTLADFQAERDMMWHLWERCSTLVSNGRSAQDMLEAGVMDEIGRNFDDPYRFLYDTAKGLWAHYTNFGGKTV